MRTLLDGIGDGLHLIFSGDDEVVRITLQTLRVALLATLFATLIGVPLGCLLGLGRFRGRRGVLGLVNAGIRIPPVAVGQLLWLLLWPDSRWGGGPLGGLHWIYTMNAVVLAQTLLAIPIVAALTAAAVQSVDRGLLAQAEAFGASWPARAALAVREARVGIYAALIAALGTAIASVGAVVVVGPSLGTATLGTAALAEWNSGVDVARSVAYGTVLLGLFLVLAAALTLGQQRRRGEGAWIPGRTS
jgi:tungstate transport system permease protein